MCSREFIPFCLGPAADDIAIVLRPRLYRREFSIVSQKREPVLRGNHPIGAVLKVIARDF
jgi:hypothetical protein